MLNPVAMSIIRNVFDDPRERAQAIGAWGAVFGLSMALGPVVGGALVDSVGWRSVFFVNVPIGAVAFVLTTSVRPPLARRAPATDRPGRAGAGHRRARLAHLRDHRCAARRLDVGRNARAVRFLAGRASAGWSGTSCTASEPLIEMRFFRSVPFSGASTIAVCAFAATGGFLFLNTLYLQGVRHLSPFHAGLYMLPMAGDGAGVRADLGPPGRPPRRATVAGDRRRCRARRLADAHPARAAHVDRSICSPPTSCSGSARGWSTRRSPTPRCPGCRPRRPASPSAIASTSRQVGMTLGVAVIGAISGGAISGAIGPSFAAATHAGWWICAGLGAMIPGARPADHHGLGGADRARDGRTVPRERARGARPRSRYGPRELAPVRVPRDSAEPPLIRRLRPRRSVRDG